MSSRRPILRVPAIDEIIASGHLIPAFQPILALGTRRAYGFESLARFRADTIFTNPALLFEYAHRKHRVVDLDLACLAAALRHGRDLVDRGLLFLNVHPLVLTEQRRRVVDLVAAASIDASRIVVEITEQGSIENVRHATGTLDALRELGVRFALDDVGIAYSHLPLIDRIAPSFLKISQEFGTGFERDATKQKIVRNVVSLAGDFGCEVVLEGIEGEATAEAAEAVGITFGQGYYFARPCDASALHVPANEKRTDIRPPVF